MRYWKDSPGPTVVDLWYPGQSRVSVAVESIEGKVLCQPSARPATNDDWFEQKGEQARYMHLGSKRLYFGSQSDRREVWFTFDGPPGEYHLVLDRQDDADIGDLFFDAFSPGNAPTPLLPPHNRFLNHIATGGSIWHGAAAKHNICPGDYVIRTDYVAADGRSVSLDKAGVVGELWKGSSVGPTIDGSSLLCPRRPCIYDLWNGVGLGAVKVCLEFHRHRSRMDLWTSKCCQCGCPGGRGSHRAHAAGQPRTRRNSGSRGPVQDGQTRSLHRRSSKLELGIRQAQGTGSNPEVDRISNGTMRAD